MACAKSASPSMQQRRGSQSVRQTNQPSRLLNASENNHLFQLIGSRCVTLASAVVQIYMGEGGQWVKYCCGVLTFIKDNLKRSYYLRVYDLKLCQCIWEQEIYNNFQYKTPKPSFHTFDSEECPAGVNFANEEEANAFRNAVLQKLDSRQQRRNAQKAEAGGSDDHLMKVPPCAMPVSLDLPPSAHSMTSLDSGTLKKDKKDKKKGKLTKAVIITPPSDFRHVSRVGWHPETGFDVDNLDPALKSLFDEAGVTANDLKDKETAAVIYDFIEQHGGMEVIKQRHQRLPASVKTSRSFPPLPLTPPPPSPFQNPPPLLPPSLVLQTQLDDPDSDVQSDDSFDDKNNGEPKLKTVQITGLKEEDVERLKSFLEKRRQYGEVSESKPNVKQQTSAIALLEHIDDAGLPNCWKRMPEKKAYLTVKLDSGSEEYKNVASGLSNIQLNIVQIDRIQNPTLYRQYMSRKKDMDRVNGAEPSNERRLWHGTSPDNIPKINLSNFNRSYCGQHGVVFGNGVYFAVDPDYLINNGYCKADQNGIKCIYQARVLTGKFTQGAKGLKEPPPLKGSERLYDSVVDNINSPGMFVVFYDPQTYPEYLVTFR